MVGIRNGTRLQLIERCQEANFRRENRKRVLCEIKTDESGKATDL